MFKILKTLDVIQIKLVLIGDLPTATRFVRPDFKGLQFSNFRTVFPKATTEEIARYPNSFSTYV